MMSNVKTHPHFCTRIRRKSADVVCIITNQIRTFWPIFLLKKSADVVCNNTRFGVLGITFSQTHMKSTIVWALKMYIS